MTRSEIIEATKLRAHITPLGVGNVGAALLRAVSDGHTQVSANEQDTWVTLGNGSRKREIPPAE